MSGLTLCIKRLMSELNDLTKEPINDIDIYVDENNIHIWYFLIKGKDEFTGGYFIGKINNDSGYPIKPPQFSMLTPTGRFEINLNICLSNTSYHAESWSPLWTMRSIIMGFVSILYDNTPTSYGYGHLESSIEQKKQYSLESMEYNKAFYMEIFNKFTKFINYDGNIKTNTEIFTDYMNKELKKINDIVKICL